MIDGQIDKDMVYQIVRKVFNIKDRKNKKYKVGDIMQRVEENFENVLSVIIKYFIYKIRLGTFGNREKNFRN